MHQVDEQILTGDTQITDAQYFALANILEQAKSLGLELEGLTTPSQDISRSSDIPVTKLGDLIKQARRKLYLQMMEFEALDMDLAELHTELQETPKQDPKPAVKLTLV